MKEPDLQFFQSELKRVTDWIQFADKKSAFLAAFYSAIFGLFVTQQETISTNIRCFSGLLLHVYWFNIICVIISYTIGAYFLILSVFPRLKNGFTEKSFCFFGTIACMKYADFNEDFGKLTEQDFKKQITEQIYGNSLISDRKMKNVQKSIKALIVLVILTALLIFLF